MCWFVILFLENPERGHQFAPILFFFFFSKDLQNILFESGQYIIGSILFFLLEFESYETKALECIFQHMYFKKTGALQLYYLDAAFCWEVVRTFETDPEQHIHFGTR